MLDEVFIRVAVVCFWTTDLPIRMRLEVRFRDRYVAGTNKARLEVRFRDRYVETHRIACACYLADYS